MSDVTHVGGGELSGHTWQHITPGNRKAGVSGGDMMAVSPENPFLLLPRHTVGKGGSHPQFFSEDALRSYQHRLHRAIQCLFHNINLNLLFLSDSPGLELSLDWT